MINERTLPYLLLAPSIAFLLVFFTWPLVEAFVVALTDPSGAWSLDNFETMAADIDFRDALVNTLLLVIVVVPLQLAFALAMAVLLRQLDTGRDLYLYV